MRAVLLKFFTLLVLLSLNVASAPTEAREAPVGTTTAFTLENGLQIVVIQDHRVPVVTHMVWYKVGAVDDPPGKSGLAHLLEHLTFKSSGFGRDESKQTFARAISSLGAIDNATTQHDTTYYYQRASREHLKALMELETTRMSGFEVSDPEILTEREVVRAEWRSNVRGDPIKLLAERLQAAQYHNHNYRRPVIGWEHEIIALTPEDSRAAYDRFYKPSNAIVVIAGDVMPDEVRALARKTYATMESRGDAPERLAVSEPEPLAARRIVLQDRRVPRPALFRSYLTPSYATAEPGEAESLEILANILGEGETSRLNRELVTKRNIALNTGARYMGNMRDSGRILFFAIAPDGESLDKAEQALDAVLAGIIRDGITEEELSRAKAAIEARWIIESDNQLKLATRYGEALAIGRRIEDIAQLPERIARVTTDEVQAAARAFLQMRRSATGILEPDAEREVLQ